MESVHATTCPKLTALKVLERIRDNTPDDVFGGFRQGVVSTLWGELESLTISQLWGILCRSSGGGTNGNAQFSVLLYVALILEFGSAARLTSIGIVGYLAQDPSSSRLIHPKVQRSSEIVRTFLAIIHPTQGTVEVYPGP